MAFDSAREYVVRLRGDATEVSGQFRMAASAARVFNTALASTATGMAKVATMMTARTLGITTVIGTFLRLRSAIDSATNALYQYRAAEAGLIDRSQTAIGKAEAEVRFHQATGNKAGEGTARLRVWSERQKLRAGETWTGHGRFNPLAPANFGPAIKGAAWWLLALPSGYGYEAPEEGDLDYGFSPADVERGPGGRRPGGRQREVEEARLAYMREENLRRIAERRSKNRDQFQAYAARNARAEELKKLADKYKAAEVSARTGFGPGLGRTLAQGREAWQEVRDVLHADQYGHSRSELEKFAASLQTTKAAIQSMSSAALSAAVNLSQVGPPTDKTRRAGLLARQADLEARAAATGGASLTRSREITGYKPGTGEPIYGPWIPGDQAELALIAKQLKNLDETSGLAAVTGFNPVALQRTPGSYGLGYNGPAQTAISLIDENAYIGGRDDVGGG